MEKEVIDINLNQEKEYESKNQIIKNNITKSKSKFYKLNSQLTRYLFEFITYSKLRELIFLNKKTYKSLLMYDFAKSIEEKTTGIKNIKSFEGTPDKIKKQSIISIEHPIMNIEVCNNLDLIAFQINNLEHQLSIWRLSTMSFLSNIKEINEEQKILTNKFMKYIPNQNMLVVVYNDGSIMFYLLKIEEEKSSTLNLTKYTSRNNNIYLKNDTLALSNVKQEKTSKKQTEFKLTVKQMYKRKIDINLFLSLHYNEVLDQIITIERTEKKNEDDIEISFVKFWNCKNCKFVKTKTYLDKSICNFNFSDSETKTKTILFFSNEDGTLYYDKYPKIMEDSEDNIMIFYNSINISNKILETQVFNKEGNVFIVCSLISNIIEIWDVENKFKVNEIELKFPIFNLSLLVVEKFFFVYGAYNSSKIAVFEIFEEFENSNKESIFEFGTVSNIPISKLKTIDKTDYTANLFMIKNVDIYKTTIDINALSQKINLLIQSISSHKAVIKCATFDYKNDILLTLDIKGEMKIWKKLQGKLILFKTYEPQGVIKMEQFIILRTDINSILGINGLKTFTVCRYDNVKLELTYKYDDLENNKYHTIYDLNSGYSFLLGKSNGEIDLFYYKSINQFIKKQTIKHMMSLESSKTTLRIFEKNKENDDSSDNNSEKDDNEFNEKNDGLDQDENYGDGKCNSKKDETSIENINNIPNYECKKQKISYVASIILNNVFLNAETQFIVSGAQDGSICLFNYPKYGNYLYLDSNNDKKYQNSIKQIISFKDVSKVDLIAILIEKGGLIIVKNLCNQIINVITNDFEIYGLESLNKNYSCVTFRDNNKLSIIKTNSLIKKMKIIKQVKLMYDPSYIKFLNDGELIFTFGQEYCSGEAKQGKGCDIIKISKKVTKNVLDDTISDASENSDALVSESESDSELAL